MTKVKNMRWRFKRERSFLQHRGLGVYWSGGLLGSTHGEPGQDYTFNVTVMLYWVFSLNMHCKVLRGVDAGQ